MPNPFSVNGQDDQNQGLPPGMIGLPRWMQQGGAQPTVAPVQATTPTPAASPVAPNPATITANPGAGNPAPAAPLAQPANPTPAPVSPAVAELTRLTQRSPASTANGKYDITQDQSRSGIEQIHNPFLRTLGRIGDAALSTLLPGAAVFTPGTQLHHQMTVNSAKNAVTDEENEAEEARKAAAAPANVAHTEAESTLENAQAQNYLTEAEARKNPNLVPLTEPVIDPNDPTGKPRIGYHDPKDPTKITYGPEIAAKPTDDKSTANVHVLPDGTVISVNHDSKTGKSTAEVVYKGDPKVPTEVKQLEVGGKPHQVLINSNTGETVKDLGETGEKPATVNVNTETSALDRESARFGKTHEANVKAANDQLEKIVEAKSLLTTGNAESQALAIPKVLTALVSGQGTGVRITQPELNSIAAARGIKGDFQAWVQKISSGKRLTPEQQQQLTGVLDAATQRLEQKRQISNEALDKINSGGSREDIVKADADARKALSDFEKGGASGPTKITSDADFAKLPKGTHFIGPDGKERVKP